MPGPEKILLIEDNKELSKLLSQRLREEGYVVDTAADGQEGLDKVTAAAPDLIIADLAMPKLNGNVVVRILKLSPNYAKIPIIMLSAFVSPEMKGGVEVPADCYMSKPFDEPVLLSKIRDLLDGRAQLSAV